LAAEELSVKGLSSQDAAVASCSREDPIIRDHFDGSDCDIADDDR
jgi:hypothetical protein